MDMKNILEEGGGDQPLTVLWIEAASMTEQNGIVAAAFARCSVERTALLIRVNEDADFQALAQLLLVAMTQPATLRPPAVSLVVHAERELEARELSFELALKGVILGDFTDPVAATTHALRERALVFAEASSASMVRSVRSTSANALDRRASLRASKRRASDIARGLGTSVPEG